MDREKKIIHTSYVGIAGNLVLVAFKMFVGLLANSIAVVLDAINNLTDALSSVITIAGAKLAHKRPDKAHPYGYGRVEYLTSMVIGLIILYAGVTSLVESVKKVLDPGVPDYSALTLVVIVAGIVVKVLMGRYVKGVGERIDAQPLVASGKDALFDSLLSAGTLVAALLSLGTGINIDGIIGALISLFIVKAGLDTLGEAASSVLGERVDSDLSHDLKAYLGGFDGVHGVFDLSIDNFGPERQVGAAHVEVDDDMTARQIHKLTREMAVGAYKEFHTILTIGIYATNTSDGFGPMKAKLEQVVAEHPAVLQMHGFYVDEETRVCYFDLVIDFGHDAEKVASEVEGAMGEAFPDYTFASIIDTDTSDL